MYINKALIFGNLTRDPELRALPSGMNVASFSIATNRVFKDRDGKKQEQTDFHNIVVFGREADIVSQYLKKGSSAFIEGRIQNRSWDDKKTGEKKYRTEIVADHVQFGPKGSGGAGGSGGGGNYASNNAQRDESSDHSSGGGSGIDYPKEDINPDDIPF
ncbi:single-stranded DNA-binding protein [Candidatus Kaiserbacteria bacterium]|nr:single-stranded DNA-binding protein [Candidatus Kaiserbacteria bacterium]